jgi:hypothetical protein
MKTDNHRSDRGGVLVVVLVTVVILGCLGVGFMRIGADVGMEASQDIHRANAFWTAEAGIECVKTMVRNKRDKLDDNIVLPNVITGATSRGSYTVSISNEWDNVVHVYKKYIITSVGLVRGSVNFTNAISLHAYLPTFARYAHASHIEGSVAFTTGDVIDGPVQVDSTLNISGTPLFRALVKAPRVNPTSAANNTSIFRGGIDVNPAYTNNFVNGEAYFASIKSAASSNGLFLTNDYSLVFKTNMFTFQRMTNGSAGGVFGTVYTNLVLLNPALRPNGGTIYINGNITVQGVVSGRVSVAAQKSIYITNDIVYLGGTNTVGDFLGLVASNSVTITKKNNIDIHAAVLVTHGGFNAAASNRDIRVSGSFQKINLFGSLGQYRRGVVGDTGVYGFRKNYMFDRRFEYDGPPSSAYDFYEFSKWSNTGGH